MHDLQGAGDDTHFVDFKLLGTYYVTNAIQTFLSLSFFIWKVGKATTPLQNCCYRRDVVDMYESAEPPKGCFIDDLEPSHAPKYSQLS